MKESLWLCLDSEQGCSVSLRLRETKLCGIKSKKSLLLLALYSLLFFAQCSYCYADVILTDSEATELLSEIELSKKELQDVRTELSQSKEELQQSKNQLEDVRNTYNEQRKSYETLLDEAEKEKQTLTAIAIATTATSGVLLCVLVLVLLL